jgi:hypothetical protein
MAKETGLKKAHQSNLVETLKLHGKKMTNDLWVEAAKGKKAGEKNNKKDIWNLQSEMGMAISAEDHPTDW